MEAVKTKWKLESLIKFLILHLGKSVGPPVKVRVLQESISRLSAIGSLYMLD